MVPVPGLVVGGVLSVTIIAWSPVTNEILIECSLSLIGEYFSESGLEEIWRILRGFWEKEKVFGREKTA